MKNLVAMLIVACTLIRQACATEVDPLIWTRPDKSPEIRERLDEKEYQSRSRAQLDQLGSLKKLESGSHPDHGVLLHRVLEHGQGPALKIQAGDILTKIDQKEIWGSFTPHQGNARRIVVFHPDGRLRTVNAKAGPVGVYMKSYWRPEITYLRTKKLQNPKWDDDVVVGCACCLSDPDLSETAWYRALKSGYPQDELTHICAAAFALEQGRHEVAADFAYLANEAEPQKPVFVSPSLLLRVMLASYKLDDAHRLSMRFPDQLAQSPRNFTALAELHRSRSMAERCRESPSQIVSNRFRDDLMPRSIGLSVHMAEILPKLREGNGITVTSPNDAQMVLDLLPPDSAQDLEFTVNFTPIERFEGTSETHFNVGFVPYHPGFESYEDAVDYSRFFGLAVMESSRLLLFQDMKGYSVCATSPNYPSTMNRPQEIRVIRASGKLEAFFDGKRILYQPAFPNEWTSVARMVVSGMKVRLNSVELHELIERR